MQIAEPNLVISAKALKKWMHRNSKTALEIFEDYNLTWLGIRVALAPRLAPPTEFLVVDYSQ